MKMALNMMLFAMFAFGLVSGAAIKFSWDTIEKERAVTASILISMPLKTLSQIRIN